MQSIRMNQVCHSADEMLDFLIRAIDFSERKADEVNLTSTAGDGIRIELVETHLTDGSTVFDLHISNP